MVLNFLDLFCFSISLSRRPDDTNESENVRHYWQLFEL
uniref:Uncharacterized protein n=1 Tax=Rhizophora mucronata TaxID=61149 RepID=A0A2P2QX76_RHIMU